MALGIALVDRARLLSNEPSNYRVEGGTAMVPITGPVFRCRLTLPQPSASSDGSGGRTRVVKRPSLLFGTKALDGSTLEINSEHRVLVTLRGSEKMVEYIVDGDPEPLRKRSRVIGWQCQLKRVEDHERREIEPSAIREPVGSSVRMPVTVARP